MKMKSHLFRAAVAFTVLAVCAGRIALGAEGDSFVVDSPFDLTLGSTNYAARLGRLCVPMQVRGTIRRLR